MRVCFARLPERFKASGSSYFRLRSIHQKHDFQFIQLTPQNCYLASESLRSPKKEKHFLVTQLITNNEERIVGCVIEAVYSQRKTEIDWKMLTDKSQWLLRWH